jgi:hypothetical protein
MRIWTTTIESSWNFLGVLGPPERARKGDAVLPDPGKPSQPIKVKFTATLEPIIATKFSPRARVCKIRCIIRFCKMNISGHRCQRKA